MDAYRTTHWTSLKFSNPLSLPRNAIDTQSFVDNLNSKFKETHANVIKAFHKYKAHYDRKAQASVTAVVTCGDVDEGAGEIWKFLSNVCGFSLHEFY